jgi:hypothetical protein
MLVTTSVVKTMASIGNVKADPIEANLLSTTSPPSGNCAKGDLDNRRYRKKLGLNPNNCSTNDSETLSLASDRSIVALLPSADPSIAI